MIRITESDNGLHRIYNSPTFGGDEIFIGDIWPADDGEFVFMPGRYGFFRSWMLQAIVDKLKQLNKGASEQDVQATVDTDTVVHMDT